MDFKEGCNTKIYENYHILNRFQEFLLRVVPSDLQMMGLMKITAHILDTNGFDNTDYMHIAFQKLK